VRSEVQVFPGPPAFARASEAKAAAAKLEERSRALAARATARQAGYPQGAIAQLGERLLCKQEVVGSIPSGSTSLSLRRKLRLGKPARAKAAAAELEERSRAERQPNNTSAKENSFRMLIPLDEVACVISDIVKRRSIRVLDRDGI
jgi:hypothetical protein